MIIKIIKTESDVNLQQFRSEIKRICELCNAYNRSQIGAKFPIFKRELGLKITELQFFQICESAGIEVRQKTIWFDQFGIS